VPLVQRRMRPLILSSTTVTSPHVQPLNVSTGTRSSRGLSGLQPRPQVAPDSSISRPLPKVVHAPGSFERPRPPPLIFCSDDEYFSTGAR
jgi:hypothetical protein